MKNFFTVVSEKNPKISVQVATGHFATGSAHRSHYIDIFDLKSNSTVAKHAAREMAASYRSNTIVDVIVYMDGTEVLAAYLAEELLQPGAMNDGGEILIITPMIRADGRFVFHQNVQEKIINKNAILIVASMSTGATSNSVLECLDFYGCNLVGISAVFSAVPEAGDRKIYSLFSTVEIPDYWFCSPSDCPLCKEGRKIDAVFSSEGYTEL